MNRLKPFVLGLVVAVAAAALGVPFETAIDTAWSQVNEITTPTPEPFALTPLVNTAVE